VIDYKLFLAKARVVVRNKLFFFLKRDEDLAIK